jgi:hypothetical protein
VFGERHLRQVLGCYADHYNSVRTHLSLATDAPRGRAVQTAGLIKALPILGGLHHRYIGQALRHSAQVGPSLEVCERISRWRLRNEAGVCSSAMWVRFRLVRSSRRQQHRKSAIASARPRSQRNEEERS